MGKRSAVFMQIVGSAALAAAVVACGDLGVRGEQPHGSLTQPGANDTGSRAPPLDEGCKGYEVIVIDPVRVTHEPTAINDHGQIVGSVINDEDVRQAWFWDGKHGQFLVGDRPDGAGRATDVNAAGHVVGSTLFLRDYSEMPGSFQFRTRPFLYDGATLTDFEVLNGNSQGRAEGINQHGDVVGSSFGGAGDETAVLYQEGAIIELGLGRAFAINKRREVVGGAVVVDNTRAFLYSDGEMSDLGTLGGETSTAFDINDRGEIVGSSITASGLSRAFLYRDGTMVELPVPGETSTALAINGRGQVVGGSSSVAAPGAIDGYVYEAGRISMLRDVVPQDGCWNRLDPRDINDHGDIVGIGIMNSDASCGEVGRYLVVLTENPNRFR